MRLVFTLLVLVLMLKSCKKNIKKEEGNTYKIEYTSFGKQIVENDALASSSMLSHYRKMVVGDSLHSKMLGTVTSVCQVKGCWMKLDLGDDSEVMVKFKDYGFFVPKDITGKQVIVNGEAYVNEVSVEELKHLAKDAGKTPEEIKVITMPQKTFSFEADGVLIAQ